ncbi:hypothetical protein IVB30_20235 [Bradyrhizobium sp. 200]|uniref:hypothetical protein n=1 Tax=Bradyrhizobium sp. 200 TaxID=2782665 RepID=UPI001FFF7EE5|nr:hypothetical protein [Bradyrhizobium sp. 200]UPJ53437.1 hypothetical protein IVB30_20235 [Bradyrhizobium sp. 200]
MPYVLTETSIVRCGHGGTVALRASQNALKINGQRVLVQTDMSGATVICPAVTDPNTGLKQCMTVISVMAGASRSVSVAGQPVLLDIAQGLTDGLLAGTPVSWSVSSAGQTKLQAG